MFKFLYSNFYDQLSKINPKQTPSYTTTTTPTPQSNNHKESSSTTTTSTPTIKSKQNTEYNSALTSEKQSKTKPTSCGASNNLTNTTRSNRSKQQATKDSPLLPDMLDAEPPPNKRAYSYSLASSKDPQSTFLNLSTPNYFSKGYAPKLPPEELPLKISKSRDHQQQQPRPTSLVTNTKTSLIRSNTLSPKNQHQRRGSLTTHGLTKLATAAGLANKLNRTNTLLNHSTNTSHRTNLSNFSSDFILPNHKTSHSNLLNNSFQSLVHYGDNIGAKVVKCLINENLYETSSLINQDYDIYQVMIHFKINIFF